MPRHSEKKILSYQPEQLFDLVADVGRYPEFLPWCKAARVVQNDAQIMVADLMIGYGIFQEKFRSEVMLDRPHRIHIRYVSGPLSHLQNRWVFVAKGKGKCELDFDVDFDFHSPLLSTVINHFFDKALARMVSAFEKRAAELYGPR